MGEELEADDDESSEGGEDAADIVEIDADGVRWHLDSVGGQRLQRHWRRRADAEGDVWFENRRSGETQWEAPLFVGMPALSAEARRAAPAALWIRREDETDVWYEQARDAQITSWELPEGAREVSEAELADLLAKQLIRGGGR